MGVKDGEERPSLAADPLHRIELFPRIHLVTDRGVKAVCHGKNGHGPTRRIGRHQAAGLFRTKASAMVEDLLKNRPRKENLLPPAHQEAGTWQTHSEEPETVVMVGADPQRAQRGSLGTLSLRKVMERAS